MSMAVVDTAVAAAYMVAAIRETAPDDAAEGPRGANGPF